MTESLAPTSTAASEWAIGGSTTGAQWTDVTVVDDNDWLRRSLRSLEALGRLEPGWDGYGSPAPSRFLVSMADTILRSLWRLGGFLPPPDVVPISGGAIQIEWLNGERELEVVLNLPVDDGAKVEVRVLRSIDGMPEDDGAELQEPKELVPHLLWMIEG